MIASPPPPLPFPHSIHSIHVIGTPITGLNEVPFESRGNDEASKNWIRKLVGNEVKGMCQ